VLAGKEDLAMDYPKLVTMYEFFRLLRGEAFVGRRPHTPEKQNEFYRMEDDIAKRIGELKKKINFSDERVQQYLNLAKNNYS
jgi:hypothetical protein